MTASFCTANVVRRHCAANARCVLIDGIWWYSAQRHCLPCILDCLGHDAITLRGKPSHIIAEFSVDKFVKMEPRRSLQQ